MTCPRCKKGYDILAYVPLRMIEEFEEETTPIYKCPGCRWIFAPADSLVREVLRENLAERNGKAAHMEVVAA